MEMNGGGLARRTGTCLVGTHVDKRGFGKDWRWVRFRLLVVPVSLVSVSLSATGAGHRASHRGEGGGDEGSGTTERAVGRRPPMGELNATAIAPTGQPVHS